MPAVHFTDRQTEHLRLLLTTFVERNDGRLPERMVAHTLLLRNQIDDNIGFWQPDFDWIVYLLEAYFEGFGDEDVDPLAEQVYCKAAGHWYEGFEDQWWERIRQNLHVVGLETSHQSPPIRG